MLPLYESTRPTSIPACACACATEEQDVLAYSLFQPGGNLLTTSRLLNLAVTELSMVQLYNTKFTFLVMQILRAWTSTNGSNGQEHDWD